MTKVLRQLVAVCALACAAFGQGLLIQVQNQGSTVATWKKYGVLNCSTNLVCTVSGSTVTMTASSTASTAFSGITASANSNLGNFSASGNSWDFTATTFFGLRVGAGLATTKNGDIGLDSTANIWHLWVGSDATIPAATSTTTTSTFALFSTGTAGKYAPRAIAAGDVPTLNQNTTGSAASFTGSLAGDVTGTQGATVVGKINGNSVPSGAAAHQILDCTGVSTCVWKTVPDCNGSSNALNYTQLSDAWSCLSISTLSNPMTTLGDTIYGGAAGAVTRLAGPTATNGVTQFLTSVPSGGAATAPAWAPGGVVPNPQTGTTYTVLATDRLGYVSFSNAASIAVTLPQAGTTGFASNFAFVACDIGAGTATITPTTSTISSSNGSAYTSAASSLALSTGQCAWIYSDNTNYFAIVRTGGAGSGTVTSVAQTVPSWLSVAGSPVTTSGTLAISAATGQTSHQVIGTCGTATSFAPCALVAGDIPTGIPIGNVGSAGLSGTAPITISAAGAIGCATCNTTSAVANPPLDKSGTGLSNPTADATFTQPTTSTTGITLNGTAPASVSTSTGTNGSSILVVTAPTGGADSNAAGTAGVGGSPSFTAGNGGAGTGTNTVGGAGGSVTLTAGNGGASAGTGANSNGGSVTVNVGQPGTGGSGTAGKTGVLQTADSGGHAGFNFYAQGTANTTSNASVPANSIIEQAPTAVTAYTVTKAGAAATGVRMGVNSSGVIQEAWSGSFGAVSQTGQTASIATATLCAATANTACGQTGVYRISLNIYGSGTACSSVTAGSVVTTITWTDPNGTTHSAIPFAPLFDQKSAAVNATGTFNFNTSLATEGATGSMTIATNGTVIQYATTYTACTTGTGTYNVKITTEQLQ